MLAQVTQNQLPVGCFRFNKVLTSEQIMPTHEFMVNHLLDTLQGQNWLMHWNPAQDYTECQILFPFVPDRVTHIRPIANYFQQHLEDPAIMYRPRNEFLQLVRSYDMDHLAQVGGWGLTTMSRLNNMAGRAIQETRTKIYSPTEVIHKYITREVPILGQKLISPLAVGCSPLDASYSPLALGQHQVQVSSLGLGQDQWVRDSVLNDAVHMLADGMRFQGRPHFLRGIGNLIGQNLLLNRYPIGLTRPIGIAVEQPLCNMTGMGLQQMTGMGLQQGIQQETVQQETIQQTVASPLQQACGIQQPFGIQQSYPVGYGIHAQDFVGGLGRLGRLGGFHSLNQSLDSCLAPMQATTLAGPYVQGFNQAVCQTLNPAVVEQQQTNTVEVRKSSPILQQVPIVKKVVC